MTAAISDKIFPAPANLTLYHDLAKYPFPVYIIPLIMFIPFRLSEVKTLYLLTLVQELSLSMTSLSIINISLMLLLNEQKQTSIVSNLTHLVHEPTRILGCLRDKAKTPDLSLSAHPNLYTVVFLHLRDPLV